MELPWEFVELLETHAEISIHDTVARKKFTLIFRQNQEIVWLPLTLEPGQRVVACSGNLFTTEDSGTVWLGLAGGRCVLTFETVERLRLEDGRFRVETFNAFRLQESALLRRRTVDARIELTRGLSRVSSPTHPVKVERLDGCTSTMRLDVGGPASLGRFRFFVEAANPVSAGAREEWEVEESGVTARQAAGDEGHGLSTIEREFVEPRRFRPRRRAGLRRLP